MFVVITSSIVLLLDFFVKKYLNTVLAVSDSIPVIPSLFHITLVHNTGSVWGLFQGKNYLFAALSFAAIIGFLVMFRSWSDPNRFSKIIQGCIIGGALSNLFDRVSYGYVIDYLDFRVWPVFNIADACITVGFSILLWQSFFCKK